MPAMYSQPLLLWRPLLHALNTENEIRELPLAVADLTFTEKKSGRVHIDIRFEKREHGDGDPFDGQAL